jgi:hypothetical protein
MEHANARACLAKTSAVVLDKRPVVPVDPEEKAGLD